MKKIFLYGFPIILLLMTTQQGKSQTEHQPYTPVQQFPGFEVRYYPEAILASVYTSAKSYRELTSPGFNTLAGYIFGGNDASKKIAMTAPVHMDIHDSGSRMSFVIPSGYEMEDLPIPDNAAVKIERSQPGYMAAITFGGYASDEKIIQESEKLRKYLKQNNIQWEGNFRFLGYNSPYKFWSRRNEVIVNIVWE